MYFANDLDVQGLNVIWGPFSLNCARDERSAFM